MMSADRAPANGVAAEQRCRLRVNWGVRVRSKHMAADGWKDFLGQEDVL